MKNYNILNTISESENSDLQLVIGTDDKEIYVLKTVKNGDVDIYYSLKGINNPNIVRVIDIDNNENKVLLEYISGKPLSQLGRAATEKEVRRWIIQLLNGLEQLHRISIIHRDIKPSNIMLTNDGIIKIIDIDTARVYKSYKSQDTVNIGTTGFAAPEQYGSAQSDSRSDIYAIGAVMYSLLTMSDEIVFHDSYVGSLAPIIKKCMELDPKNRYQSISELRAAIIGKSEKNSSEEKNTIKINGKNIYKKIFLIIIAALILFWIGYGVNRWNSSKNSVDKHITIDLNGFDANSKPIGVSSERMVYSYSTLGNMYVNVVNNSDSDGKVNAVLKFLALDSDGNTIGIDRVSGATGSYPGEVISTTILYKQNGANIDKLVLQSAEIEDVSQ